MSVFIQVKKDFQGRIDSLVITRAKDRKKALRVQYLYSSDGVSMLLNGDRSIMPSYSELLSMADAKFTERTAVLASQPSIEDIEYYTWLTDGNYPVSWEEGFYQNHFHGRMGAYYKSESGRGLKREAWTKPEILHGENTSEPYPWQSALRMRNSIDGIKVDELYVGFPKAMHKGVIAFAANLPSPAGLDQHYIGWEITSGGSWALITALCLAAGAWTLRAVNYAGALTEAVTLRHPDVYARYALSYNETANQLKLWQAPIANRYGFPLELTDTLALTQAGLPTILGKGIPFFANEDSDISEFKVSRVWVYELP